MTKKMQTARYTDKRLETRRIIRRYYSVQFSIKESILIYQFKLRDISPSGLGILVRQDSKLLTHLEVGEIVEMTFCPVERPGIVDKARTKIVHITKAETGRYKGHFLVGLSIQDGDNR